MRPYYLSRLPNSLLFKILHRKNRTKKIEFMKIENNHVSIYKVIIVCLLNKKVTSIVVNK